MITSKDHSLTKYFIMHPSFDQITEYIQSGQSGSIEEHLETCERCHSMAEGIKIAQQSSIEKKVSLDNFFEESKLQTKTKINLAQELIPKQQSQYFSRTKLAIAASIILILSAFFYLSSLQFDTNDFITTQINQKYPAPTLLRDSGDKSPWNSFSLYFERGNYKDAIGELSSFPPDDTQASFYRGLCYMYMGEYDQSIELFETNIKSHNRYNEQASWFLALSYLKSGYDKKSTLLIEKMSSSPRHFKQDEARKLLKNL